MWHLHQKVEAVRHAIEGIHVFRKALPVEGHALCQRCPRDVFDALHQRNQIIDSALLVAATQRRKTDTTIAEDDGAHAVMDARAEGLIPARLPVEVGVDIDEARRQPGARSIDTLLRLPCDMADFGDETVLDADVRGASRLTAAVDDGCAFKHQIVHQTVSKEMPGSYPRRYAKCPTGLR